MKRAFLSRRHRNPHQHDEQQKEQPFFSKSSETQRQPFFSAAGRGQPVQAKLAVGQPGDKYEQEADSVADQVVNGQNQTPAVQRRGISAIQRLDLATPQEDEKLSTAEARMEKDKLIQEKPELQMAPAEEREKKPVQMEPASAGVMEDKKKKPVQMQPASAGAMEDKKKRPVQMQPAPAGAIEDERKKPVQMQPASPEAMVGKEEKIQATPFAPRLQLGTDASGTTASAQLSSRIQDSSGKGQPLPGKTRAEMEGAIGTDFSGVNIHTDASAAQMNKELGAQAFTHGQDVYFNSGKYSPENSSGRHLLAHELTHVVQQQGTDQISPYRPKTAFNFGAADGAGKTEEEFKDPKTQPWIQTITIVFDSVLVDADGRDIPQGTATAEYFANPAALSGISFQVTGGSGDLGQTRPGKFTVHRIEGVGYNDLPIPAPRGEGPRRKYAKDKVASMHLAVFFDRGRALHSGNVSESSHGCVHVGDWSSLVQLNYHSVVGKTKARVFFVGDAYTRFIKSVAFDKNLATGGFTFDGRTKVRDALFSIGDFETADKQGASSLSQLVIRLNNGKLPKTGAIVEGATYQFHIVAADGKKDRVSKVKIIRK